jgi:hypothetical protein
MDVSQYRALTMKGKAKYRNSPAQADGMRFDSKLERDRYLELKHLQRAGVVLWFICQPPFRLPGGITYRADFLRVNNPNCGLELPAVEIEDVKGYMTRVSANKIKMVEEIYGIKVEIITKVAVRSS